MGWKNRQIEYEKQRNNKVAWNIFKKYSNELHNLIIKNRTKIENLPLIVSQINGKFYSELKSNKIYINNRKFNNIWSSKLKTINNILNKNSEKTYTIVGIANELIYISTKYSRLLN